MPWARHGARHTRAFEDTIAWLACAASKATICELMRTGWRTIGHIITRVAAEAAAGTDRLAGLRRIGIDEISYRKGHKYLVVVDHDTGLLIWAAPGRTMKTVASFFDALGPDRTAALTHVSADGASYIATVVSARAPAAIQCTDPFHVVSWAAEALDQVPPRSLAGRPRAPTATKKTHVPMHVQILDSTGRAGAPWARDRTRPSPVTVLRCQGHPGNAAGPAHPPSGVLRPGTRGISVRLHRTGAGHRPQRPGLSPCPAAPPGPRRRRPGHWRRPCPSRRSQTARRPGTEGAAIQAQRRRRIVGCHPACQAGSRWALTALAHRLSTVREVGRCWFSTSSSSAAYRCRQRGG